MLWKFYKNDPDVCHYLFGTMHLATDEAYTFADIAQKYIMQSALYAGEMNLDQSYAQDMTSHFLLTNGERIQNYYRPKQYVKACKIVHKSFGIDLQNYDHFTPFFITNLLSELTLKKTKSLPLDHHLWQFATNVGKEMHGVESLDNQISIMEQIPLDYQIKGMKDTIKNISAFRQKINHLNQLYALGEEELLYKSSHKSMGKIRKLMIYERNQFMTARILSLSSSKTCFFAIGAAHFPGGKGILANLKKEGYKVRKLI